MQFYSGFRQTYKCLPMTVVRPELEDGGKIIMPQSSLMRIAQLNLVYPLMFQLKNHKNQGGPHTHCGVLEFTAEEGRVYIPYWMMQNLGLQPNDFVIVTSTELPRASFVKLRPKTVDFLDISDPRAVLEHVLRKFSALTVGETILFRYNNKDFYLEVLELKPQHSSKGVSIIETDAEVDFAPPEGYQEPDYKKNAKQQQNQDLMEDDVVFNRDELDDVEAFHDDSDDEEDAKKKSNVPAFTGAGYRISGKPIDSGSKSAAALSKSPNNPGMPELATSPGSGRHFITASGRLVWGSPSDKPASPAAASASSGATTAGAKKVGLTVPSGSTASTQQPAATEEKKPTFTPFAGKGYSLK
eukprot:TRINITY_DN4330_c0_g1_i1.p1 TRINITY_DN4330_c0_g1~~TRINITY_DN4330_c0_g1_i1.p1  ORF type:complete len:356 (-),score=91.42 TRINITY_DN4330_c0_g1_i1:24-1091(-)